MHRPADHDAAIRAALQEYWGFDTLRPLQREAIDAALAGRDSLVVLPTGGGKSLCYQVPPLIEQRLTVVVSPLIALMQDQVEGLRLNGYPAAAIHAHVGFDERDVLRTAAGELRLLFVAPERLFAPQFLGWLDQCEVGAFAIDEAHCISQWGHDFRPEYRRLAELRARFPKLPFHAYTATATPRVRDDIVEQLGLRDPAVLIGTFDRPNLTYRVLPRTDRATQVAEAIARHEGAAAIVYCIARKDTEALAEELCGRGLNAAAYHAGLDGKKRTKLSEQFRTEKLDVVVATVAFGMGIDRGDVRLVVHAAMPKSIEGYQQETGRAGRDGLPAECLLLYSGADAAKWRTIVERSAEESGVEASIVRAQLDLLNHMQRFANGARCRHRALSEYFGQDYPHDDCGACDVCLAELVPAADAHVVAQKILSAVARCGQSFGARHVIDVLRGSRVEKVVQRGHDKLSTFGLLAALTPQKIANYIDQLIDQGDLERTDGEYPVLRLTRGSAEILKSERQAVLLEPKVALAKPARGERRRGGAEPARELHASERDLFEALRRLRRALATELGVPPYVVFNDVTLEELARLRPTTPTAMLAVKGVGQKKLTQFGDRFLTAIAEHDGKGGRAAAQG
jgi:ATP-dependent DNA helicase RecQ